ncbi:MAG: NTF2-like N-terminal transpeptidase domain-containing protein [Gammaproteobacteria bacterium]
MADELAARRHRRLIHRALPALGSLALLSLGAGLALGGLTVQSDSERVARDFGRAWARGDYAAMHRLLSDEARASFDRRSFEAAYRNARTIATATSLRTAGPAGERDGSVPLPVAVVTRVFGRLRGSVLLPVRDEAVDWTPSMVFPGLREGETLSRRTSAPERAAIRSVDGKTLAEGPAEARTSPIGQLASSVAGTVEQASDKEERLRLFARGFHGDTPVGRSGLERMFE